MPEQMQNSNMIQSAQGASNQPNQPVNGKKPVSPEKVAERVYQLLLEDARIERERRG